MRVYFERSSQSKMSVKEARFAYGYALYVTGALVIALIGWVS